MYRHAPLRGTCHVGEGMRKRFAFAFRLFTLKYMCDKLGKCLESLEWLNAQ
jgi:hypothetical protein